MERSLVTDCYRAFLNKRICEQEKKILKQAEIDIKSDDLVDWDDLRA